MDFGIGITQRKKICFLDSVRVEAMSLMACPLFYLIKISILTRGMTVLTSAVCGNSEELKNQAGMLYGKQMSKCYEPLLGERDNNISVVML